MSQRYREAPSLLTSLLAHRAAPAPWRAGLLGLLVTVLACDNGAPPAGDAAMETETMSAAAPAGTMDAALDLGTLWPNLMLYDSAEYTLVASAQEERRPRFMFKLHLKVPLPTATVYNTLQGWLVDPSGHTDDIRGLLNTYKAGEEEVEALIMALPFENIQIGQPMYDLIADYGTESGEPEYSFEMELDVPLNRDLWRDAERALEDGDMGALEAALLGAFPSPVDSRRAVIEALGM